MLALLKGAFYFSAGFRNYIVFTAFTGHIFGQGGYQFFG
jgi:hypothetical protein